VCARRPILKELVEARFRKSIARSHGGEERESLHYIRIVPVIQGVETEVRQIG
jgi:hypothetical protein